MFYILQAMPRQLAIKQEILASNTHSAYAREVGWHEADVDVINADLRLRA